MPVWCFDVQTRTLNDASSRAQVSAGRAAALKRTDSVRDSKYFVTSQVSGDELVLPRGLTPDTLRHQWDIDFLGLEEAELVQLSAMVFKDSGLLNFFKVKPETLSNFLHEIASNYHAKYARRCPSNTRSPSCKISRRLSCGAVSTALIDLCCALAARRLQPIPQPQPRGARAAWLLHALAAWFGRTLRAIISAR